MKLQKRKEKKKKNTKKNARFSWQIFLMVRLKRAFSFLRIVYRLLYSYKCKAAESHSVTDVKSRGHRIAPDELNARWIVRRINSENLSRLFLWQISRNAACRTSATCRQFLCLSRCADAKLKNVLKRLFFYWISSAVKVTASFNLAVLRGSFSIGS